MSERTGKHVDAPLPAAAERSTADRTSAAPVRDARPATARQRTLQGLADERVQVEPSQARRAVRGPVGPFPRPPVATRVAAVRDAPIQRTKWKWDGKDWVAQDEAPDYSKKPKWSGKKFGEIYDDSPAQEKEALSPAEEHKEQQIAPYLALLDHLAGEADDDKKPKVLTGGHLLSEMQKKWKGRLKLTGEPVPDAVWTTGWSVDGVSKSGTSTMFPSSWTREILEAQLRASEVTGNQITLMPSGILIKKAGNTFYPVQQ